MINWRTTALLLAGCLGMPAWGQWTTLTGTAPVAGQGMDQARQQAINNALSQASGDTMVVETLNNGVLSQGSEPLSQVGQYQVISEHVRDDVLEVTLQADVRSIGSQCDGAGFRQAITVPRAQVVHREQLVPGSLYELDAAISRLLSNTLNGEARSLFAHSRPDISFDSNQLNQQYQGAWAQELTIRDNSQYIAVVRIDDLTVDPHKPLLGWFAYDRNRYFGADLSVYDGLSGQLVWQNRYRAQGDWPYERTDAVNIASSQFWNSEYGQQIRQTVTQMAQDLDATLHCRPLNGRVLAVNGERVTINLGSRHGVRVGDRLALQSRQQDQQSWWPQQNGIKDRLVVEQVQREQAIGRLQPGASYTAWQPQDLVRAQGQSR
ncbi:Flagellar assembly protein T, C-terminal domain [Ferrimonas sediminum]|uniref:Flagellar assembly protein T, C-terminal domain n=1 Tax=Ferrimonas sediminum TaxID=718193 RepID=A0A1G8YR98_9GAMM|nr:flagellar assembly protein T N-terminal domain-containing protein [Ferrimonas sediminum]SDK05369.1 Flagellar assembly protein T, C-terminal domain [Ferrimonas sediminum]